MRKNKNFSLKMQGIQKTVFKFEAITKVGDDILSILKVFHLTVTSRRLIFIIGEFYSQKVLCLTLVSKA